MDTAPAGRVIPDCRCGTHLSTCRTGLGLLDLWEILHNQATTAHGGLQYHLAGFRRVSPGFARFLGGKGVSVKLDRDMVDYLSKLKAASGETNASLAEEINVSVSTVQRYLVGDVKDADPEVARRLIIAMGGTPNNRYFPQDTPVSDIDTRPDGFMQKMEYRDAERERTEDQNDLIRDIYERIIKQKNRWIIVLSIVLGLHVLLDMMLLTIDAMTPKVGWIRHALGLLFPIAESRLISGGGLR